MMSDNEVLEIARQGLGPFVNRGLVKLGARGAELAVGIMKGELDVSVDADFGAKLCMTCHIFDRDGNEVENFSLGGMARIVVDPGKVN
jgi:hypothetical protein